MGKAEVIHAETEVRVLAIRSLVHAIKSCHPDDALHILAAAADGMSVGGPLPAFLDAADDATFWASIAAPHEVEAYLVACASELSTRPVHKAARKRAFLHLWKSFSRADQRAFIRKFGASE